MISIVKSANKLSLVLYLLSLNMFLFPARAVSSVNMSELLSRLLKKPDNCTTFQFARPLALRPRGFLSGIVQLLCSVFQTEPLRGLLGVTHISIWSLYRGRSNGHLINTCYDILINIDVCTQTMQRIWEILEHERGFGRGQRCYFLDFVIHKGGVDNGPVSENLQIAKKTADLSAHSPVCPRAF